MPCGYRADADRAYGKRTARRDDRKIIAHKIETNESRQG